MQQLACVRPVTFAEGRAEHMRAVEVKNGPLQFQVLTDKGLDLGEVSWKGVNINFLSKPGLMGRNHFDTKRAGGAAQHYGRHDVYLRPGKYLSPCTSDGKDYPMHGRIRTTPAEHVCSDAFWEEDAYVLTVSGEMREAELFGENMVLRRKITTVFPGKSIVLEDTIENQSFRKEPMMLLYHCNVGWPLLGEDCEMLSANKKGDSPDADAAPHTENYSRMESPLDNEPEYVFLHELAADGNGETFAAVINPVQNLGIRISFNVKELPYFMEWKSRASGDYVIGLEPANSSVYGRLYHEERGDLHMMAPQSVETKKLVFTFLEGEELEQIKEEARYLVEGQKD